MRILVVEDDTVLAKLLRTRIIGFDGVSFCEVVFDVESAHAAFEAGHFDVALVDLVLPTAHARGDAQVENGRSLMQFIAERCPGTFVIMYSEFSNERLATELYEEFNVRQPNILGTPQLVFTSRPKSDPGRALEDIRKLVETQRALRMSVEFTRYEEEIEVDSCHAQLLRAFGATRDARAMTVSELRGGKSGATVYSVRYSDRNGNQMLDVVAKCDLWRRVREEENNFQKYVVGRLANGTYAPLLNTTPFMCGMFAAMFYERLDDSVGDLTAVWSTGQRSASELLAGVKAIEARWSAASTVRDLSIRELRRLMIPDAKLSKHCSHLNVPWAAVEELTVRLRFCLQHGDLHAGNILISKQDHPYLLDFANIAELPAGFDSLTLELAYIFNNPERAISAWPQIADVASWPNAAEYFAASPARFILSEARKWTEDCFAGLGQRSIYASAYAYCIRQVQYDDVDKTLLNGLLQVLCARLLP